MLDKILLALRLSDTALNEEVQDTIDACFLDMERVGIAVTRTEEGAVAESFQLDPLVVSCVKLYCRWQYNFEDAAERYMKAYISCRDGMSLCGDYV